jgi:hypothetical protein
MFGRCHIHASTLTHHTHTYSLLARTQSCTHKTTSTHTKPTYSQAEVSAHGQNQQQTITENRSCTQKICTFTCVSVVPVTSSHCLPRPSLILLISAGEHDAAALWPEQGGQWVQESEHSGSRQQAQSLPLFHCSVCIQLTGDTRTLYPSRNLAPPTAHLPAGLLACASSEARPKRRCDSTAYAARPHMYTTHTRPASPHRPHRPTFLKSEKGDPCVCNCDNSTIMHVHCVSSSTLDHKQCPSGLQ